MLIHQLRPQQRTQLRRRQCVNNLRFARNALAEKYIDIVGRRIQSHVILRDKVYYIIVCAGHYAASLAPEIMPLNAMPAENMPTS